MDADPAAVGGTQPDPVETQYDLDELAGSVSARHAVGGVVAELAVAGFVDAVEVGRGGFGVVYRCRQVGLGRSVAVKVLTVELEDNRARFVREQQAMAQLTGHPNIVSVLQVGEIASGQPFLVMPYCGQGSVRDRIAQLEVLGVDEVLRVGVKMAAALASAHRLGIVHRDVKPANVLLTDYGQPALCDFGIAHTAGREFRTATGFFIGSPAFTAPEIIGGDPPSPASDVYGLGATLFCGLTGHAAFERRYGEEIIAQFARIAQQPLPDLRDHQVPDDVATIVERAMARNPQDRPTAQQLGELLQHAQAHHGLPVDDMALHGSPSGPHRAATVAPMPAAAASAAVSVAGAAASHPAAEYKQVTVLFADVVDSMDIAAVVGAERLREIMTELVTRASAVVRRFGGTVDKFTGDGIMAVFGAPASLEDHAFRACLAGLGIQDDAARLAVEVDARDGVKLQLRVALNSGEVIAGEIGSGGLGYTAVGTAVWMAQRLESVAPPGAVMLSESTARLVEDTAVVDEPQLVHINGATEPVRARRLCGVATRREPATAVRSTLVGREVELHTIAAMLDRAVRGRGCVVNIAGPPGIGKSRLVFEAMELAKQRGVEVFSTHCEAHASDIAFTVVARLLRAVGGISGLDAQTARARARTQVPPDADPQDLVLLDDLVGIADPEAALPNIDPDARRRRLTGLINAVQLARTQPALFIIEDIHWIDEVSESMLADFHAVIPHTPALVLTTYRPEYRGTLAHLPGAQTLALAPLTDAETTTLIDELLGADPSVRAVGEMIAARAGGNPFFAEEIVRELAEGAVLQGDRGGYVCHTEVAAVRVPATLQAAIAARIDRLGLGAKQTLSAAAVIGSRFSPDLLASLGIEPVLDELVRAELVDQVRFTGGAEYGFHHPLIRTVCYESQLKSDRTQMHRRLAATIEARQPESVEANAALIAEHLEAAGDLRAAYGWHMRAAAWATNRDIAAARLSWERAVHIADALPADDPNRAGMRIAPRTMLCGIAWRVHVSVAGARFDELRALCDAAGDKASLAIGMAGLVMDHALQARMREASQLASEAMALAEAVGDPTLTVGLSLPVIYAKIENAEWPDVLQWSQRVIDLANDDPTKGHLLFGSPLALALSSRAIARYFLGQPGWRDDLRHGLAMARSADPLSYATVVTYAYFPGIPYGVLRPDDRAVREIEDALQNAERSGVDFALAFARMTLGLALVHRQTAAERDRGQQLLAEVSELLRGQGHNLCDLPIVNVYLARERARRGDRDDAIPLMRAIVDDLFREGRLLAWGVPATGVLVETLLDRGAESDVLEAKAAIDRLARLPADDNVLRDIWLLRLQALLARAHGDAAGYAHVRDRYRDMARTLEFEGHIAWPEATT
jgi:class 3 adenylate cyclase